MTTLRSRLRLWATAWLVFQAASLAALAPGACCATARSADAGHDRHAPAAGVHCPMPAADGSACPMHRARSAAAGTETARLASCACETSSLFTLIATPGILTDDPSLPFLAAARPSRPSLASHPSDRVQPVDPRPPRA